MFDFCIHYTTFPQKARLNIKHQNWIQVSGPWKSNRNKKQEISQNFLTLLELFGWKALVKIVQLFHVL